jgi:hypothetical protein
MTKSRRMSNAGHVGYMEMRSMYKIVVRMPEEVRSLRSHKVITGVIKMTFNLFEC